ncbi:MAG: DNA primase [Planctomycetota bacterium]|nr:DNA primase [Planctomycetota bacterium]
MSDAVDFKELVRARTDIVAIVGESIALMPRRGEYVGLCPFHDDHSPSLHVYPDRQSFRCWVCDTGGDVFSFVMKHEGVTFADAVDLLGEKAGLERPKRARNASEGGTDKPRLHDVMAWADRQFKTCLKTSSDAAEARDYIASRGISAEMVERFGIGFHPPDWQWLQNRARGTYTGQDLVITGLARERSDAKGLRDEFYDRVLFPIRDERGRVVAFGGRVLPGRGDEAGPKYLNSSDTPIFSKSKLVYALDVARKGIGETKTAVVMEGYTDCIAAHQHGYNNVVATLGTALAESHVALLKRFAQTVVLVYDGDEAGLNAAERALVRFLAQDVDLRILALPEGLDPADYLAKDDSGGFGELLRSAPTALEFKLDASIKRFGLETDFGQSRLVDDLLRTIVAAPQLAGTPREGAILQKIASKTGLREQQIRDELKRLRGQHSRPRPQNRVEPSTVTNDDRPSRPDDPTERETLAVVLTRPDLFELLSHRVGPDDFQTLRLRAVFEHCRDVADMHGNPAYDLLMSSTDDPGLKQLLVGLDADARRRDLPGMLGEVAEPGTGAADGTDAVNVPPLFHQLVRKLEDRRQQSQWQQSYGRFVRRHAEGPLDEDAKAQLRLLHRQMATRHSS